MIILHTKKKEIDTSYGDRIVTPLINSKSVSKAERNTNIRGRINNEYDSVEELLNRVRELGTDAQDKSNKDYVPYTSPVDNYGEKHLEIMLHLIDLIDLVLLLILTEMEKELLLIHQ